MALADVIHRANDVLTDLLGGTAAPEIVAAAADADRVLDPGTDPPMITLCMPATGDCAHLFVMDHEFADGPYVLFSPARTCVGVTMTVALALATAMLSGGRYSDEEIGMLPASEVLPAYVVARTALAEPEIEFVGACERYVRQFPALQRWPEQRAMNEASEDPGGSGCQPSQAK